jgi:hypothetical protein
MSSFALSIPSSEGINRAVVSARRSRELLGGQEGGGSVLPSRARPTVGGTRTTCQTVLPGPGWSGAEGSECGGLLHGLCLLEWQPADRSRSKLHDPPPAHQRTYMNMVDHT